MKLIGAGFGRMGTMSLKAALERIGYGPCFHMIDLITQPEPLPYWEAAARGEHVDWDAAFDGWESTVDWPGCTYWDQLAEEWPDAPVLLNSRDPEAWYRSCVNSIHAAAEAGTKGELKGGTMPPPNPDVMRVINTQIWHGTFEGRFLEKDFAMRKLHEHYDAVRAGVPRDRLLEWEIGDGWAPLCGF
ncbi:MAG: sulfotransferase family protein, partial [Actinobacteria bacterium]|nr:sulfotransferase family protein [Actinomycetota bacterium]